MDYPSLLINRPYLVADKVTPSYFFLTERHIQIVWYEQKYFKNLKTYDGKTIQVISPGIWNAESGPDFWKAHLMIDGQEFKGDVEIHLNDEAWINHQHHIDSKYDQVVFHLSLWKPKNFKELHTSKGKKLICAHLEDCLTISPARIVQLIDLDLYPYKQSVGTGACSQKLFKKMPLKEMRSFFQSAANWRLLQKQNYLSARSPSSDLQFPMGIAMALGYKNNTEAFLNLFHALLPYRDEEERVILAIALGSCGFFEERYQQKWAASDEYQALNYLWLSKASELLHQTQLKIDKIRPLNHPIRRLVYLCKLLRDSQTEKLFEKMHAHWTNNWQTCAKPKEWRLLYQELKAYIPAYKDPYWNFHFNFEMEPQKQMLTLMGEDLKAGIILNSFLPQLFHEINKKNHPAEIEAFERFYQSIKNPVNSKTTYLNHRFLGETNSLPLFKEAVYAQGAFQLHQDFCLRFEASCEGCPFVERYQQQTST